MNHEDKEFLEGLAISIMASIFLAANNKLGAEKAVYAGLMIIQEAEKVLEDENRKGTYSFSFGP